jgi:hypothetical protein
MNLVSATNIFLTSLRIANKHKEQRLHIKQRHQIVKRLHQSPRNLIDFHICNGNSGLQHNRERCPFLLCSQLEALPTSQDDLKNCFLVLATLEVLVLKERLWNPCKHQQPLRNPMFTFRQPIKGNAKPNHKWN